MPVPDEVGEDVMPITADELSRRIRLAREACGLTQEQVAEHLGMSRSSVVQLERGKRSVSSLELDCLAHLFGRDIREFVAEGFEEADALVALFRAEAAALDQPTVQQALRDCVELGREIRNLEELLDIETAAVAAASYELPPPNSRWEAIRQGERLAGDERRRLDLSTRPLPDLVALLGSQGVRTGLVAMPEDVSGLTLNAPRNGLFVVANESHGVRRRRFSFAHEYAHVLADRDRFGLVSRGSNRDSVVEVRANAFAASFLMPAEGVREELARLGKGRPSRPSSHVFDESVGIRVEGRTPPRSQAVQLHDVVQLAHHFGVSRIACLYRLRNLRVITEAEFDRLRGLDDAGHGRRLADALELFDPDAELARGWFRHRVLTLAIEAFRREEVSEGKLVQVVAKLGVDRDRLDRILEDAGFGAGEKRKEPER